MALVDHGRSLLEFLPERLADILGHGAEVAPFVVESLQRTERSHRIGRVGKLLGRFDKLALGLEIFLEIEVAQLFVHLQMVVELLHNRLESLPGLRLCGSRDILYRLEILLKLLEFGEFHVDIVDVAGDFLHLVDDLHLLCEVLLATLLVGGDESRAALLEFGVKSFHLVFHFIGRRRESLGLIAGLYERVELFEILPALDVEKRLFNGCHLAMGLHIVGGKDLFECVKKFLLAHGVEAFSLFGRGSFLCRSGFALLRVGHRLYCEGGRRRLSTFCLFLFQTFLFRPGCCGRSLGARGLLDRIHFFVLVHRFYLLGFPVPPGIIIC